MEIRLWAAVIVLGAAVAVLLVKLCLIKKSAGEIRREFADRLTVPSNASISISTRDPEMRGLAVDLNAQLKKLREMQLRYLQGDAELKEAVASLSHDIRTPLTAISGYVDLLQKQELGEQARVFADH